MDNRSLKPMVFIEKTRRRLKSIRKKDCARSFNLMNVFFLLLALLCGRATLLGVLRPFGGAFFAAAYKNKRGYAYMIASAIGQVWSGAPFYEVGKYIFAMSFFALIIDRLPRVSARKAFVRGGIFSFALALSGSFFTFTSPEGPVFTTYYDIFLLFIECVFAFGATIAFFYAIPVIQKLKLSYSFSTAEEISLVSLFGCALWGAKDITNFLIFNLANILCLFIIILFSVRLGSGKGVIAGLVMGLVSSLGSGRVDISCVSYAFSALVASLLGKFGAITACSGFIFANALITALANGSTEVLINIFDIFAACVLYSLIPEKVLLHITNFGARDEKDRIASDEKLFSDYVFTNTQRTVTEISKRMALLEENRQVKNEAELRFFERFTRRSCHGCGMRRLCWSRDVQKSSGVFTKALDTYRECGDISKVELLENCIRKKEMKEAFVLVFELYRLDVLWQERLKEAKATAHRQALAFSQLLEGARKSLFERESFDRALSDDISRRLRDENVSFSKVVVMRDDDNDPTVILSLSPCGGFSLCERGILEIISTACGTPMIRAGKKDCSKCSIRYVVAPSTRAVFSFAKESRNKKKGSGDSVLYRIINKNLFAAVLCDGMGYGEKAFLEAKSYGETLLDLIEAGIEGEKAVELTSSLLLSSGETTFSATDLCLYDAKREKMKIIKCGSAATFTKCGERVDALYSKTIPLGALRKSDIETFTLSTRSGDIFIMVSDGVLESGEGNLKDGWLIRELEDFSGNDGKKLSELIVEKAMEKCSREPSDDITVLAAVIE